MKRARKVLIGSIIIAFLTFSLSLNTVSAQNDQVNSKSDDYKNLLKTIDSSIRSLRFGKDPTDSLKSAQEQYVNLLGEEDEVYDSFGNLIDQGKEAKIEDIRDLRGEVKEIAEKKGISLPFYYEHAIFVILGISLILSFMINWINRVTVDWEMVNAAKAKMNEWQKEFREAQREGNKKKIRKLKLRQDELMDEQKTVMGATMKPMLYYIIPFMLLWWYLNSVYGGWVVAWVPFTFPWPNLGFFFFTGSFVSVGFLGWYLISYFGLAQVFRKFLVPG